ncbi:MAG: peptidyl-prolyl cis-trans isomerase [Clostridiales bacterium]|nr:peptidyl-prolyl cis-trans isomerase [Clostridiales bacterium]
MDEKKTNANPAGDDQHLENTQTKSEPAGSEQASENADDTQAKAAPDPADGEQPPENVNDTDVKDGSEPTDGEQPAQSGTDKKSDWEYPAEVQTDLGNIDLTYEDKKIEVAKPEAPAPALPDNENEAAAEEKVNITISKRTIRICGIVVGALAAVALVVTGVLMTFVRANGSEIMTPANVAYTIGDTKVSVGMYNFYYNSITSDDELTTYEYYYGLDNTVPYDEQIYDEEEEITWAQYFEDTAMDELSSIIVNYEAGIAAGVELSTAQEEYIDSLMESMKDAASTAGQSFRKYLKEQYGNYIGEKTLRSMWEKFFIALNYSEEEILQLRFTQDEIQAYLDENEEEFYTVAFRYLPFTYDEGDEDSRTEALEQAEEFQNALGDAEEFLELSQDYAPEGYEDLTDDDVSYSGLTLNNEGGVPSELMDWLFQDSVKRNDSAVIEVEDYACFYVVQLEEEYGLNLDTDTLYSVRHILIQPDVDDVDSATDEQWAEAKQEAEELLEQYKSGELTEVAFARLAEEHSMDTASTSTGSNGYYGGQYNAVPLGQMVEKFESWSTDDARQYGDVDIVETDYGYHIMFFISCMQTWQYEVHASLQEVEVEQQQNAMLEELNIQKGSGHRNCAVAEPAQ